ncbi:hypothetical protein [Hyunsoonleella rubra]|uniref:PH domain-containing protein n=1 Tax=Hyunsoonleella rubra TaxID=1737062 RepID=A0ABW5TEN8_9FLAO
MSKKVVLHEEEILDSISQVLLFFCSFLPSFVLNNLVENQTISDIISYLFIFGVISIMKISRRVSISNNLLVKDIYTLFLGRLRKVESFPISEIEKIELAQNNDLYFEIVAKKKDGKISFIKKMPNKNPAMVELERIKSYINI